MPLKSSTVASVFSAASSILVGASRVKMMVCSLSVRLSSPSARVPLMVCPSKVTATPSALASQVPSETSPFVSMDALPSSFRVSVSAMPSMPMS